MASRRPAMPLHRPACGLDHRRAARRPCTANRTYLLMNEDGQITEAHSISAASIIRHRPGAFLAARRRRVTSSVGDRR